MQEQVVNLGKTRQINFYNIDEKFYFVDLPRIPDIVKCLKKNKNRFGKFIEEYLFSRKNIALIVLIVDIRHKLGENDLLMYQYIKNTKKPYLIIANKADKIAITKVSEAISKMREELGLKETEIILPFSAERKIYSEEVWNNISNWS